ncbi:MAG: HAD-superfamily hydrolase, subfamily variant 1 [Nocardioidaceae bacterium]|nr:HAD-superfamily hydrolase, subfamily variant 1 [Nocardioidaceae bacterium]
MNRLLLLDLDDTLCERPPIFREWAAAFLADTGLPATVDDLVELDEGGHVTRRTFHQRLADLGLGTSYDDFVGAHEAEVSGRYRLTDDASVALDEARAAGWRLGIVTNGYERRQSLKIAASGLADRLDAVCISQEAGVSKPDPAIFRLAAERAGTTLDGAWMVGDNLDADIAGARNAGIGSVWVQRPREWLTFSSGAEPDLVAKDAADGVRQVLAL